METATRRPAIGLQSVYRTLPEPVETVVVACQHMTTGFSLAKVTAFATLRACQTHKHFGLAICLIRERVSEGKERRERERAKEND